MMDLAGTKLPIVSYLPKISTELSRRRVLALAAEPGAGKSTIVPPFMLGEPWMAGRRIVMLEPRRLAAVAIAARIAELLDEPLGRRAGFRVRTASRIGPETRIEVVTEALLTRMIQQDPLLDGVGLIIIDEFHERSIHADLALALSLEVRRARPDLALLIMSATLDAEGVSLLLDPDGSHAPVLRCPGSLFPVEIRYEPISAVGRWEESFTDGLARLFDRTEGDILAFLPGAAEIRRVGTRLGGLLAGRAEVLPLHGLLPLEDQRRIASRARSTAWDDTRRVILSTSIAETSLTVPGIRTVADSGWARLSRLHHATGLDRLVTERVSESSAEQRRGRAGRMGPGLCVRFWSGSESLPRRPDPEILRSDLSGLVLECALWGAVEPGALRWMDPPSPAAWNQAWEILRMLGLVEARGPTGLGRKVAGLGLSPRLGVLAVRGADAGEQFLAAACAAILEERDGSGLSGDPDFRLRLELLRTGQARDSWRRSITTEIERILRRAGAGREGGGAERGAPIDIHRGWTEDQEARVGNLLAFAFPDRIARREPDGTYRLVTGRAARFPSAGSGAGRGGGHGARTPVSSRAAARWIVAPDADAGETAGVIRLAAPADEEVVDRVLAVAAEETREIRWEGLVPKGYTVRRAGRLVLSERAARPAPEEISASFGAHLARQGLAILPWNERSRGLLARLRFYAKTGEWLAPFLTLKGGQVLGAGRLVEALRSLLGSLAGRFESEVPESIGLPTGGRRRIDYLGAEPAVEARIQEVFGLSESPRICGVPLTFRLLSPAQRPLQITRDLAGFWKGTYAEVRKEMRGRYPKHYWPENPLEAEPTRGVRPSGEKR
jgi:ATP-dependent helicase HrpB